MCSMCLRPGDTDICDECLSYKLYYESLTLEGRREEERMIAQHVAEAGDY